ncbi:hypothetical protein [Thermotoga sp. KOL6]|uniref:hypothetical protein n=1 Tax=Thermotoga sp. KOL6 TaxID=126741 RepID=UPI000C7694F5|nr:hypothetical protein [Thermotoga sp. KOL6]PLV60422.1 hypothetical protein AS005_03875 [Thermotoga sp. KOL6]
MKIRIAWISLFSLAGILFTLTLNTTHLERLSVWFMLGNEKVKGYWVYAEKIDGEYKGIGAKNEGDFCVDDAARVILFYSEAYEITKNEKYLTLAMDAAKFVIKMQASDGNFYNFAYLDGTINKYGPTSAKKTSSWWTLRAFWGLSKLAQFTKDENIIKAVQKAYNALKKSPPKSGDKLALYILGLSSYNKIQNVEDDIKFFSDELLKFQVTNGCFQGFFSTEKEHFRWHGWGNRYAEALVEAYKITMDPKYLEAAKKSLEIQIPILLGTGLIYSIENHLKLFPELSYSLDCTVTPAVKIYRLTGEEEFAYLASLGASWLFGGNRLGVPMMGPNGEGYDGLEYMHVNQNAGAESTVSALRVVLHSLTLPEKFIKLIESPTIVSRNGITVIEAEGMDPGISPVELVLGNYGGGAAFKFEEGTRLKKELSVPSGTYRLLVSGNFSPTSIIVISNDSKLRSSLTGQGLFDIGSLDVDKNIRVVLSGKGILDQIIMIPNIVGVSFKEGDRTKSIVYDFKSSALKLLNYQVFEKQKQRKEEVVQIKTVNMDNFILLDIKPLFNNDGFGTPSSPGNFDNLGGIVGAYLPAQEMSEGIVKINDIPFILHVSGLDNVRCVGQKIILPETLKVKNAYLLAASNHGDYEIRVSFEDKAILEKITDWCKPDKTISFDYRFTASGEKQFIKCGIDLYVFHVDSNVKEIKLPEEVNVHIFAITLEVDTR